MNSTEQANMEIKPKRLEYSERVLEFVSCPKKKADLIDDEDVFIGNVIGALEILQDAELVKEMQLGGVISAKMEKMPTFPDGMSHMELQLPDDPNTDLLSYFDECYRFIQSVRATHKSVFIHCEKGISRSATILAAYLMKKNGWDPHTAISRIESHRMMVNPNSGFVAQLILYYQLKYRCPRFLTHEEMLKSGSELKPKITKLYRQFQLKMYAIKVNCMTSGYTLSQLLREHDRHAMPYFMEDPVRGADIKRDQIGLKDHFNCRSCRRQLFGLDSVIPHKIAILRVNMKRGALRESNDEEGKIIPDLPSLVNHEKFHDLLYIFPQYWMAPKTEFFWKADIVCPHCRRKLGFFNWEGENCPCGCGERIQPAFRGV